MSPARIASTSVIAGSESASSIAAPIPKQKDVFVGRVVEAVDVAGASEDDVVLAGGLLARFGEDGAAPAHDEQELIAVRVAVRIVTGARWKHGPTQGQPVRACFL